MFLHVLGGSTLVAAFSCGESEPSRSAVGVARSAVTSAEFSIACEPAAHVAVATQGNIALVAWTSGDDVHIARFDSDGNVLDAAPTVVPTIPPPHPLCIAVTGYPLVSADGAGFALAASFHSFNCTLSTMFTAIASRTVGTDGTVSSTWSPLFSDEGTDVLGNMWAMGNDGTNSYVVHSHGTMANAGLDTFHVTKLDGTDVFVSGLPMGSILPPRFGGFGCRTGSCFMTWQDPNFALPAPEAQVVVGLPSYSFAPVTPLVGAIAGTPTGFIQAGPDDARAFSPGTIDGPVALGVASDFQAAVHDGVATRVILHDAAGVWSGTLADDATIATPITNEIAGWSNDLALASFGSGRSVVVHASPSGVTARFIGNVPASVPLGCSSGTGGSGSGSGGAGGATASAVTVGVTVSGSATTGVTTSAVSSSASGGGAGGATSTSAGDTTVGVTSSTAASSTSGSGAATTDAGVTSSGVGGADANPEGGGCSVGASDVSNGNGVAWAATMLGITMATRSRRRRAPIAAS